MKQLDAVLVCTRTGLLRVEGEAKQKSCDARRRIHENPVMRRVAPRYAAYFGISLALVAACTAIHAPLWISALVACPAIPPLYLAVCYGRAMLATYWVPFIARRATWRAERQIAAEVASLKRPLEAGRSDFEEPLAGMRGSLSIALSCVLRMRKATARG